MHSLHHYDTHFLEFELVFTLSFPDYSNAPLPAILSLWFFLATKAMAISFLVSFLSVLVSAIVSQSKAFQFPAEFYTLSSDFVASSNASMPPPQPSPSPSPPRSRSPTPPYPPLVPAFFIMGDSSVDCGTNNFLGTFARADRLPYGRDFDTHQPTGRFCNGRLPVDYLALRLGLPFVPSYLGQSGTVEGLIQGVNYASAAAGIIFFSGSELGQRVSFAQQIQQFTDTFQQFVLSMGEEAATDLVSSSVFYLSIGINDYIHFFLPNVSNVQNLYPPWSFNQLLATTLREEIKNLYSLNVRKLVVMGMAPIGCAPHYLWQYQSNHGECVEEINNMIMEFNFVVRYMVGQLVHELPDADIIFCDMFEGSMDIIKNHNRYGFKTTINACCGLGRYGGWIMCMSPEMACRNASNHVWWDQFHPTEAVNAILADNVWNGLHTKMCYPMNLEDMVARKKEHSDGKALTRSALPRRILY